LNINGKNPTLDQMRPLMTEFAAKAWHNFIDSEKKLPDKIQSQLQQVKLIEKQIKLFN
jgi:hypothetical protein